MTQIKNVNIVPDGSINRVHVSQGDIGRQLQFNLYDGALAYTPTAGSTIKIQGTKPSGYGFSETCTWSGNVVTVATTEGMTQEYGYIPCELQITKNDDVLGTSNFILVVEKNPHPSNVTDGTVATAMQIEARMDELEAEIGDLSELETEAKTDLVSAINEANQHGGSSGSGLTEAIKQALLQLADKVAYIDDDGQDYYDDLYDALYPPVNLSSISCVYTQSGTVYDTDSLDSLKSDLVVTAHWDDNTTSTVASSAYTLSGTLTEGTSTITVTYSGKTTTFTVTVTEAPTDTTPVLDTTHLNYGQSATFGQYTSKTGFCPTVKYELGTLSGTNYDYIKGIIPVDSTASTTSRVWFYHSDDTGNANSAYGSGKPMQSYSDSMTEGQMAVSMPSTYVSLTIPCHVDYLDDSYLYVASSGKVLFAGRNTPYYGMENISEASS